MLEVILDTETTGISISEKHKIIEIGCIELNNLIPTNNVFHAYLNPERPVSAEAFKVHGYSDQFLSKQKLFSEISENFLNFIKGKKLVIHNAPFDLSFLDYELRLINQKPIDRVNIVDTLEMARQKYPGSHNSLDALCKRYSIDNSRREKHSAIIDCQLLKEVYINLLDQKEPKLNLENLNLSDFKIKNLNLDNKSNNRKIIKPSQKELELHKEYLKISLPKNHYS
jgi:DNA polymerase-3 subunit epsilon